MNIATILICILIAVWLVVAIRKIIQNKKNGNCCCSAGCEYCSMRGSCEKK